ncbi:MAG: DUF2884 family protein [Gammaproteobacteria bacterium]
MKTSKLMIAAVFCLATAPALATPAQCDELHDRLDHTGQTELTTRLDDGGLEMSRDGKEVMRIERNDSLWLNGKAVPVTAAQRKLLARYVAAHEAIREQARELGIHAAAAGLDAAATAFEALLSGDADEIDQRVKQKTDAIEEDAGAFCRRVSRMADLHDALAAQIPGFPPLAGINYRSID